MNTPVLFLTALFVVLVSSQAPAVEAKPNIVYILADDLGYGDVQCLNPERGKIRTPNLDKLASQGMIFTDAHGGSSVCTPTRYGILTGRYAWRTRLQGNVLDGYVPPLIAAERLTVPALLKQQGFQTACIGKWHLGFTIEGADKTGWHDKEKMPKGEAKLMGAPFGAITHDGPLTRGFDTFFGFHHARMMRSVFDGDRVTQLLDPVDMLPALVKRSREYVAKQAKFPQPFFLYLALSSPHEPILPTKEWQGKSGLGKYGDFVMQTDAMVGEVLAALEQAGIDFVQAQADGASQAIKPRPSKACQTSNFTTSAPTLAKRKTFRPTIPKLFPGSPDCSENMSPRVAARREFRRRMTCRWIFGKSNSMCPNTRQFQRWMIKLKTQGYRS